MLLAAGREVVSKTSAYNITKLSYCVEVRVTNDHYFLFLFLQHSASLENMKPLRCQHLICLICYESVFLGSPASKGERNCLFHREHKYYRS